MKKEKLMIKLKPLFQKELFSRVILKYKGSINASKYLKIPPISLHIRPAGQSIPPAGVRTDYPCQTTASNNRWF